MEYVSAGESHGPALTAIVTGVPAGLSISEKNINSDLARRQGGYGRGGRRRSRRTAFRSCRAFASVKRSEAPCAFSIKNDELGELDRPHGGIR